MRLAAPLRVVHGSPESMTGRLFPERDPAAMRAFAEAGFLPPGYRPPALAASLARVEEPVLVYAHTHIPWRQRE